MKNIHINLNFINQTKNKVNNEPLLDLAIQLLKEKEIFGKFEINLTIVNNLEIKALNKKYLGKDKVTDVLSFPIHSQKKLKAKIDLGVILLGEIVISYKQAEIQAKEKNKTIQNELEFLYLHGLKHLLGYHHR